MINVGIVDDHAIVRTGLKQFISEEVDLRVVGEAANGRDAIDLVRTTPNWMCSCWTSPCRGRAASTHWA